MMQQSLTGATIGSGYRVDGELSGGNMGMVYVGTQLSVDRRVAIKVIDQERALNKRSVDRFFHEARIISRLEHPHIVRLYDFGRDERFDLLYLVMEFIQGPTLNDLLRTHRFSQPLVLELAIQICRALIESHAQSVVHRDLKPANILLSRMSDGSVQLKVVDFGVARALETLDKQLTAEGAICGTPRYMPPEQARHGAQIDGRADLYALGLILYEMLCGYPPFDAEDAIELIFKHLKEEPRPLSNFLPPDLLHPDLERLVHDLLMKSPSERPADALVVLERLERLRHVIPHGTETIRLSGKDRIYEELLPWMAPAVQEARAALVYGNTSQIGSEELDPLETEWDHSHTVKFNIHDLQNLPAAPQRVPAPAAEALAAASLAHGNSEPFEELATQIVPSTQLSSSGFTPLATRPVERAEHTSSHKPADALETLDPAFATTLLDEERTAPVLKTPPVENPSAFPQGKPVPPRVNLPKKNKTLSDTLQTFFLRMSGRPQVVTGVAENTAEDMFLRSDEEELAALEEERSYLEAQRSRQGALIAVALLFALVVAVALGVLFSESGAAEVEVGDVASTGDAQSSSSLPSIKDVPSQKEDVAIQREEELVAPTQEEDQPALLVEDALDMGREDASPAVELADMATQAAVEPAQQEDEGDEGDVRASKRPRTKKSGTARVSTQREATVDATKPTNKTSDEKRKSDDLRWLDDI